MNMTEEQPQIRIKDSYRRKKQMIDNFQQTVSTEPNDFRLKGNHSGKVPDRKSRNNMYRSIDNNLQ